MAVYTLLFLTSVSAETHHLVMGVFPYVSTNKIIQHNNVFRKYVNKTSSYQVSFVTARNLQVYINNLKKNKYDLVFSAPHLARYIEKKYGYQRVAMTTHKIQGVYLCKKDANIYSLDDLKGKIISLTPPQTIIRQMVERQFSQHGLAENKNLRIKNIKTFSNAIYDVKNDDSDAAVTGIKIWKKVSRQAKNNLRQFALTPEVSGFMIMAKPGVKKEVITAMQKSLIDFNHSTEVKKYIFKGFRLIQDDDMKALDYHSAVFEKIK